MSNPATECRSPFTGVSVTSLDPWERNTFTNTSLSKHKKPFNISSFAAVKSLHQKPQLLIKSNIADLSYKTDRYYNNIKKEIPNYVAEFPYVKKREIQSRIDISYLKKDNIESKHNTDSNIDHAIENFEKHLINAHQIKELYTNYEQVAKAAEDIKSSILTYRHSQ